VVDHIIRVADLSQLSRQFGAHCRSNLRVPRCVPRHSRQPGPGHADLRLQVLGVSLDAVQLALQRRPRIHQDRIHDAIHRRQRSRGRQWSHCRVELCFRRRIIRSQRIRRLALHLCVPRRVPRHRRQSRAIRADLRLQVLGVRLNRRRLSLDRRNVRAHRCASRSA